ncbi:MAG TPA: hypothetical protein VII70_01045 [Steroidobacteraceae bacterium]
MSKRRAAYIAWLLAAPALMPFFVHADDANATKLADSADVAADAELLEYLGDEDAEGQEWMEFLAHQDIAQAASAAKSKKPPLTAEEEEK